MEFNDKQINDESSKSEIKNITIDPSLNFENLNFSIENNNNIDIGLNNEI